VKQKKGYYLADGLAETFQDEKKPGRSLLQKINQDYFKKEDLTSWKKTF
jgi:hypothetical protein